MIAAADFCRPQLNIDRAQILIAAATADTYTEDDLVLGADPYIAQLFAEHQAELAGGCWVRPRSLRKELIAA